MTTKLPTSICLALFICQSQSSYLHAQIPIFGGSDAGKTAAAPGAAGAGQGVVTRGDSLVAESIRLLESRHSIVAEISHQIDIFGHQFTGKGQYREQRDGPQPKVRLDLKIPMDDTGTKIGALVQVCDGRYLWTYRRLLDDGKLGRVDLDRVAKAVGQGGQTAAPPTLMGPIGAGGLPGLMQALRRQFTFELVGESTLTGTPVWQLRGVWRPERLAQLLPNQKDAIRQGRGVDLSQLPPHLPDHVLLTLGKEDFFPYRFEYRRTVAGSSESRALVTMTLPSVNVNVPIDPSHFQYGATELEPSDDTQQYIQSRLGESVGGRQ